MRLAQGDYAQATVYSEDPAEVAARFARLAIPRLHVVDLDGAKAGRPRNADVLRRILASVGRVPVQLGGGLRDLAAIEAALATGVARVVLGTLAAREPAVVREAARRHPGRIAVGIDARDGQVAVEGWRESSEKRAIDLARELEDAGVAAIIFTDIGRDGMLQGPNLDGDRRARGARHASRDRLGRHPLRGRRAGRRRLQRARHRRRDRRARALHRRRRPGRDAGAARMLLKRIIPCLDVDKGRVVKGVRYVDHVDAGDPVEVAKLYDAQEADEITFLDISASHEGRRILLDAVSRTAESVFMPLTVGGGVRSLQDVRDLLNAGADKVSIMTAAVENPDLVSEAAVKIGSANLVVAIDCRASAAGELGGLHARRTPAHRARRRRVGGAHGGGRRRRDPAHQHGSRRHAQRLRPRACCGPSRIASRCP